MSKIRVLSEQLANQIAAGEVVERPSSVVKELVENSLDAGACRIQVEIEGSGTRLIRIIDDGEGMDEDDILLSLERHGTSKIRNEDDLIAINSLGFRGEAIPSIGSVSILSITSRTKDSDLGHKIEVKYGKLVKSHQEGCPVGTIIEIRNLFGNTPARKKFLRSTRTEQGHIDEVIKNYALLSEDVAFELRVDGRQTMLFERGQGLDDRLAKIMRHNNAFLPLSYKEDDYGVRGFLVSPEQVALGPARMRFFVNGRAVKDRMVIHAVTEGMRGFLMKGKNPAGLLLLSLPASDIDVNVHPAKSEIRFRNSHGVHGLVQRGVEAAMRDAQKDLQKGLFLVSNSHEEAAMPLDQEVNCEFPNPPLEGDALAVENFFTDSPPILDEPKNSNIGALFSPIPAATPYKKEQLMTQRTGEKEEVEFYNYPGATQTENFGAQNTSTPETRSILGNAPLEAAFTRATPAQRERLVERSTTVTPTVPAPTPAAAPSPSHLGLSIMGQVNDLYIFCRNAKGIVVIDQHAAHERLIYERLKKNFSENKVAKQNLLFPETVELSLYQTGLVEKHLEDIERMGFSLREFGGNSYVISAIPALIGTTAPQKIFFDVLEQFGSEGGARKDAGDMLDTVLATMACRAAVKAGTGLNHREMESLLEDMAAADLFSHCPHGRPVVRQFTNDDIKKWFYRT